MLKTMRVGLGVMANDLAPSLMTHDERFARRDVHEPWRAWYNSSRWRKLRMRVLQRDRFTCKHTGQYLAHKTKLLVAHHKIPHHGDPNLFWNEDNLETVSKKYHDTVLQSRERTRRGVKT